jgi:hypothetical protein
MEMQGITSHEKHIIEHVGIEEIGAEEVRQATAA